VLQPSAEKDEKGNT